MLSSSKLLIAGLFVATTLAGGYAPPAVAQSEFITREYRPAWSNIPTVRRPTFNYSEVQNSKLISEAGESLDFLTTDNLIVGSVLARQDNSPVSGIARYGGFQVRDARGNVFYVDNIEKPKCAVIAQQVEGTNTDIIGPPGRVVSNVYIEEINFRNCY